MSDISVRGGQCELQLDATTGDLKGISWFDPKVELVSVPQLAENFRLLLKRNGTDPTYFHSREQRDVEIEADDSGARITYRGLTNGHEDVDIDVVYTIDFAHEGIDVSISIDNRSDFLLTEVMYAIIGGFTGMGRRRDMRSMVPGAHVNLAPRLFHTFPAGEYGGGNLGIRHSACGFLYPGYDGMSMSWSSFYNEKTGVGLYYGSHDPETRLTGLYLELRPCTTSAVRGSNWPDPKQLPPAEPVGLTMGWLNFPWSGRGDTSLGPIHLRVHPGDWRRSSGIYREWFDQHFPISEPTFLREQMAWQSTIMRNPEGVTVHTYGDLPAMARDAKKYDVGVFELCGWDKGGIDRGYPDYVVDPNLGSRQDLRDALQQIRAIGVSPVIFANLQVADTGTPEFEQRYRDFAVKGPWADDLHLLGFGEGTISARLGLTNSNMAILSLAHPSLREHLVGQLLELVRDGASAIQLDKTVVVQYLDFNEKSPLSPDRSAPEGLLLALQEMLTQGRQLDPRFALASETWWDRTFPFVQVLYSRMVDIDIPSPALLYTFPEITSTVFAENPADFDVMNNGMRYGMVWALAPRHYHDSVDEELTRPLARHVQELIRIRSSEPAVLFHGRHEGGEGATVTAHPDLRYSVLRSRAGADDGVGCVVVNFGSRPVQADVTLDGCRALRVLQPFSGDATATSTVRVSVQPHSLAVVLGRQGH